MIQSFQCPICGTLNALGEPECSECGQAFVYNCPVCGSPLNNRYPTCPNCHTIFNWGTAAQLPFTAAAAVPSQKTYNLQEAPGAKPAAGKGNGAAGLTARPMFWVILLIICAVLIALLLIAGTCINK